MKGYSGKILSREIKADSLFDAADQLINDYAHHYDFDSAAPITVTDGQRAWTLKQYGDKLKEFRDRKRISRGGHAKREKR